MQGHSSNTERSRRQYALVTALLALAILAVAPVMGKLRDALLKAFPGSALFMLMLLMGAVGLGVAIGVARRLAGSDDRAFRVACVVAATALVGVQLVGFQTGLADVNVVEKVHILEYGLLSFCFARAMARRPGEPLTFEHLWLPMLLSATLGVVDEAVQGFFQLRTGDIRDVLLNGLASVTGALLAVATSADTARRSRLSGSGRRKVAAVAALWWCAVAVFFFEAHVGVEHHDPEIGTFRSWFDKEELARLTATKERLWRHDPPTGLSPWGRQDYYLTEAAWHANHRNHRLDSADWPEAWRSNQILEKYYDPFLDIESFRGSGKHRWPDSLRAQVEHELSRQPEVGAAAWHPSRYESPVLRQRIHVRPRWQYVTAAVGPLLVLAVWGARRRS